jgi:hypothetical protein
MEVYSMVARSLCSGFSSQDRAPGEVYGGSEKLPLQDIYYMNRIWFAKTPTDVEIGSYNAMKPMFTIPNLQPIDFPRSI